jgi:hypothetical protein
MFWPLLLFCICIIIVIIIIKESRIYLPLRIIPPINDNSSERTIYLYFLFFFYFHYYHYYCHHHFLIFPCFSSLLPAPSCRCHKRTSISLCVPAFISSPIENNTSIDSSRFLRRESINNANSSDFLLGRHKLMSLIKT